MQNRSNENPILILKLAPNPTLYHCYSNLRDTSDNTDESKKSTHHDKDNTTTTTTDNAIDSDEDDNDAEVLQQCRTTQNNNIVRTVLRKEEGQTFGLIFRGGLDANDPRGKGVFVWDVKVVSVAASNSDIKKGMQICSINGTDLRNATLGMLKSTIQKSANMLELELTFNEPLRKKFEVSPCNDGSNV